MFVWWEERGVKKPTKPHSSPCGQSSLSKGRLFTPPSLNAGWHHSELGGAGLLGVQANAGHDLRNIKKTKQKRQEDTRQFNVEAEDQENTSVKDLTFTQTEEKQEEKEEKDSWETMNERVQRWWKEDKKNTFGGNKTTRKTRFNKSSLREKDLNDVSSSVFGLCLKKFELQIKNWY